MARISSQGTRMYVQSGTQPAPAIATAITKAAPAVVTFATLPTGVIVGDVVVVKGSGFKSLDDKPFGVSAVGASSLTLYASDTTRETGTMAPAANVGEVGFIEFCMATATFSSPPGSDIDVTTLCDEAREVVAGLPALATWAATGFWDSADPAQTVLGGLYNTGTKAIFKAMFQDGSGLTFYATTTSLEVSAGIDQAIALSTGGTVSGGIRRIIPASAGVFMAGAPLPPPEQPAVAA